MWKFWKKKKSGILKIRVSILSTVKKTRVGWTRTNKQLATCHAHTSIHFLEFDYDVFDFCFLKMSVIFCLSCGDMFVCFFFKHYLRLINYQLWLFSALITHLIIINNKHTAWKFEIISKFVPKHLLQRFCVCWWKTSTSS